jgi:NTP pyrophosphatase (non-canonical NTP hydrolase)
LKTEKVRGLKKMSYKEKQEQVDLWISQFKIKYFSPHEIVVQLSEEIGELAEAIYKKENALISEEISDVVFALICMTNRHEIRLEDNYEKEPEIKEPFLNLAYRVGQLSRELSHIYGPK